MKDVELKPCPFCGNVKGLEVTTAMDIEACENFEQCGQCSYFTVVCNINDGGCGVA